MNIIDGESRKLREEEVTSRGAPKYQCMNVRAIHNA